MLDYKVKNNVNPLPMENIHFGGKIGQQASRFFYERTQSEYARTVVYQETEDQFRLRNDDETPVGYWRGEFWGKWMISACRVARYEKDDSLKEFLREAAHRVIATADPDGYIEQVKKPMLFSTAKAGLAA